MPRLERGLLPNVREPSVSGVDSILGAPAHQGSRVGGVTYKPYAPSPTLPSLPSQPPPPTSFLSPLLGPPPLPATPFRPPPPTHSSSQPLPFLSLPLPHPFPLPSSAYPPLSLPPPPPRTQTNPSISSSSYYYLRPSPVNSIVITAKLAAEYKSGSHHLPLPHVHHPPVCVVPLSRSSFVRK